MRVLLPAIPGSTERISPLVTAIQSRHQEDPHQEQELPNTIEALLWACCSPHDFGMPEVSPLSEALRTGDDEIVLLLLQHRASPPRREDGSNDPIFVAIQMSSAENVRRLLQFSRTRDRERPFRPEKGMRADADLDGVQLWKLPPLIHIVNV